MTDSCDAAKPSSKTTSHQTDWLFMVGLLTWAVVVGVEAVHNGSWLLSQSTGFLLLNIAGYPLALLGFLLVAYDHPKLASRSIALSGMTLQAGAVLFLQWLEPRSMNQILLIMWSSQLPYFFRLPTAISLSALALLLNAALRWWLEPQQFFWFEPLMYWTFSLFAMLTSHNAIVAQDARAELTRRNAELEATQNLLAASAQESERLRIARDLHDSMGHHLTALALQLEILQHQNGEAAEQTQAQARQLVKLLLADVRATVSNLRNEHSLQISELVKPLLQVPTRLKVQADIPTDLTVHDARIAETLLRVMQEILTNSWRHGNAQQLSIQLRQDQQQLILTAHDDGQVKRDWQPGNGLKGLRERVQAHAGKVSFGPDAEGHFAIRLSLPQQLALPQGLA